MNKKKFRQSIVSGYKLNYDFKKDQLSKVLNLDSYHSYVSLNLSYPNQHDLIDKVLPFAIEELSQQFPFVLIRSASLDHIELLVVFVKSFLIAATDISVIGLKLSNKFPGSILS